MEWIKAPDGDTVPELAINCGDFNVALMTFHPCGGIQCALDLAAAQDQTPF
jgi:hypothetical protein